MAVILIIKEPDNKIKLKLPYKAITLGRSSKADVKINDSQMSSKHCSIHLSRDNTLIVKDLGSTNGTYINGSRSNMARIYIGDMVSVGNTKIQIDKSKLTKKEEKDLFNNDRTSIRFIDNPDDKSKSINRNFFDESLNEDALKKKVEEDDSHISVDFNMPNAKEDLEKKLKQIQRPKSKPIAKEEKEDSENLKGASSQTPLSEDEDDVSVHDMFDGGYVSSGATQMMKLDTEGLKSQKDKSLRMRNPKAAAARKNKKGKKRKKDEEEDEKSFFQKLFSIFGK